jgi:hypothetical protein
MKNPKNAIISTFLTSLLLREPSVFTNVVPKVAAREVIHD